jgi:hypothetical protein
MKGHGCQMGGKPMTRDFLKGAQQKNKAMEWGVGLNLQKNVQSIK